MSYFNKVTTHTLLSHSDKISWATLTARFAKPSLNQLRANALIAGHSRRPTTRKFPTLASPRSRMHSFRSTFPIFSPTWTGSWTRSFTRES